ncbi:uncharacterized protein cubi_03209 [Cryptosporidium ubiquitum]|uniref:A-kinase anchor protein 7-like phosphoesterase domain-containing protein n=1 Tax=Cryptosporidium ubiquitum TaxID=857276 RepID=A0A1J4MLS1_9CRYT|nr:uncharacterized protein cubi_03209 [Cryptosporidium ubiquitum]OII75193.1 hypothetical protein cubi_03209 [Cryptosporidium ubiquitum]
MTKKKRESKEKLAEERKVVGAEIYNTDEHFSQNSQFHSNEIEKLDENILFPPTNVLEIRNIFQKLEDEERGRMVNEYVDLSQIPANLMRKLSFFKPTDEVQVNRDGDFSDSESDEPEESAQLGLDFENLEFADDFEEANQNLKVNQNPTHFFSLAFNHHSCNLIKEFRALKKTVGNSTEYGEIKPSYFIEEKKLHITLGLVQAETPQELALCENALLKLTETREFQDFADEASPEKGFPVELHGLGYFGSPNNSRVVYAKISENHKVAIIKRLWFKLCEILIRSGVKVTTSDISPEASNKNQSITETVIQEYNPHVTFINTKYGSKGEKQRLTFNSSKLVRSYSKKSFGPGYISEIQLNELSGLKEIGVSSNEEQVYKTISFVKINGNE